MKRKWKKLLWIPIINFWGAKSYLQMLFRGDKRFNNYIGWLSPEMDIEWDRFFANFKGEPEFIPPPGYQGKEGDAYHDGKNLLAERARNHSQIVGKEGGFYKTLCLVFFLIIIGLLLVIFV